VLLHGRLRLLAASIRAAALILATWMREKPPASVVQLSRGFDLQKGHVRVIGLTGSTSNARLDFGIPHILLSKQPLASANAGDDGQVGGCVRPFWGVANVKLVLIRASQATQDYSDFCVLKSGSSSSPGTARCRRYPPPPAHSAQAGNRHPRRAITSCAGREHVC
jgi:hypothetical protein